MTAQHKHRMKDTVEMVANAKDSINNNKNKNNNNNHQRRKVKYFIKATAVKIANAKAQLIAETTKPKTKERVSTAVTIKMTTDDKPINNRIVTATAAKIVKVQPIAVKPKTKQIATAMATEISNAKVQPIAETKNGRRNKLRSTKKQKQNQKKKTNYRLATMKIIDRTKKKKIMKQMKNKTTKYCHLQHAGTMKITAID